MEVHESSDKELKRKYSTNSRKQYMNKMKYRQRYRKDKNEPKRNFGAEEHSSSIEKFTRLVQH